MLTGHASISQVAIYNLLDDPKLTQYAFHRKLCEKLTAIHAADVAQRLSWDDVKKAYKFYEIKKKIYEAKVDQHAARNEFDRAERLVETARIEEDGAKRKKERAEREYKEKAQGAWVLPGVMSLATGVTAVCLSANVPLIVSAVDKVIASAITMVPALAPQLASQNASIVAATTVACTGVFVAGKAAHGLLRSGERRRAKRKFDEASMAEEEASNQKRRLEERFDKTQGELEQAQLRLQTCVASDTTGTVYEEADEDADDASSVVASSEEAESEQLEEEEVDEQEETDEEQLDEMHDETAADEDEDKAEPTSEAPSA